jgi:hypothetical protein
MLALMSLGSILQGLLAVLTAVGAVMSILRQNPKELAEGVSNWRRQFGQFRSSRLWRYMAAAFLWAGGIGVGLWLYPPLYLPAAPSIRVEFQQAYKTYGEQLKKPRDNAILATLPNRKGHGVIQGQFENAWLLWLDNPGKLYAIPIRDPGRRFLADNVIWPQMNVQRANRRNCFPQDRCCRRATRARRTTAPASLPA